jgi:acetyltransferase-like isoleucine patch superfamily enzyme
VPPARVSRPDAISIGDDVTILEHAWLSVEAAVPGVQPELVFGDGCHIGRFVHIACVGTITFGRGVVTSDRVFIADTYHDYLDTSRPVLDQPMAPPKAVHVGDGAFLGVGCAVLLGVTVGAQAYVGAGAVVTGNVAPRTLVVGNPARAIREWDDTTATWIAVD